jgi:hypothetical protein
MFPPGAAAGQGGGGGPSADNMAAFMQYLPLLMKWAAKLPGLIVGYVAAWIVVLLVVGPSGMKRWTAEGGGFGPDLVAVVLFPILLRSYLSAAAVRRERLEAEKRVSAIAREARLANTEPLD